MQPPHPTLQLQDLPLKKYRDPDSWALFSAKPGDFLTEATAENDSAGYVPNSRPIFLGCLRMDLDPALTEREDLEAVFEYMLQNPTSNRFEMRMQSSYLYDRCVTDVWHALGW